MKLYWPWSRQGPRDLTNDDASRDTSIGVRCTDSRNTRVQSKRRCLRNPEGNRNNMPHRRMVPRTQGRVRRWGRTHIVRLGPVRVRQFLTSPTHL